MEERCGGYEGVILRGSTIDNIQTSTLAQRVHGTCPASHPYHIPGTECCAQGEGLYKPVSVPRAQKRVATINSTQLYERDERDQPGQPTGRFGKKTLGFRAFRKAYKKNHPGVSDYTVLKKYLAGLDRLRA